MEHLSRTPVFCAHPTGQPSAKRTGWSLTWQNFSEEPLPHGQLDVSLVEAWLEGDGAEGAFQRSGLLELCSEGDDSP